MNLLILIFDCLVFCSCLLPIWGQLSLKSCIWWLELIQFFFNVFVILDWSLIIDFTDSLIVVLWVFILRLQYFLLHWLTLTIILLNTSYSYNKATFSNSNFFNLLLSNFIFFFLESFLSMLTEPTSKKNIFKKSIRKNTVSIVVLFILFI